MIRILALVLLAGFAGAAAAQQAYDVTVTMPTTTGTPGGCILYLDGVAVDQDGDGSPDVRTCGVAETFSSLLGGDGTYDFAYTLLDGGIETAVSPAATVNISTDVSDPTSPPDVTIECVDETGTVITCPAEISITVS